MAKQFAPMELYIGLITGTSMDAIDAVLVDFSHSKVSIYQTHSKSIPTALKHVIRRLTLPGEDSIDNLGTADVMLGHLFADACNELLQKCNIHPKQVKAIGSHGQSIRHRPNNEHAFTLQIGDPNIIAEKTGITTVADFRRRDMAAGGQGAPLVPAFHKFIFHSKDEHRIIINIGGIANITVLNKAADKAIFGFDTGPGNTLSDNWVRQHLAKEFDHNGEWAAKGKVDVKLIETLLADDFFSQLPPKSTGPEYFNLSWLTKSLPPQFDPVDIQTTLVELTAKSIINSFTATGFDNAVAYVCGGGVHNQYLMQRLQALSPWLIESTKSIGMDPDWVEAATFAWLAQQTLAGKSGNLTTVTGAKRNVILGAVYQGEAIT